ncbi:nitric oxide synthase salivary gland, partial [Biomphalaria pfeifferi]
VLPMSRYYLEILAHESLVLIVTDTYGNGEPPYNGQEFAKSLYEKRGYEIIGNS